MTHIHNLAHCHVVCTENGHLILGLFEQILIPIGTALHFFPSCLNWRLSYNLYLYSSQLNQYLLLFRAFHLLCPRRLSSTLRFQLFLKELDFSFRIIDSFIQFSFFNFFHCWWFFSHFSSEFPFFIVAEHSVLLYCRTKTESLPYSSKIDSRMMPIFTKHFLLTNSSSSNRA